MLSFRKYAYLCLMIANDTILHVYICFRYVGKVPKFWIVCRRRSWYVRGRVDQIFVLNCCNCLGWWLSYASVGGKQNCAI